MSRLYDFSNLLYSTGFIDFDIYTVYPSTLDTMEPDTAALLAQIDGLGKNVSNGFQQERENRKQLRIAARNLSHALEEPGDVIERVCFQVRSEVPL